MQSQGIPLCLTMDLQEEIEDLGQLFQTSLKHLENALWDEMELAGKLLLVLT